MKIALSVETGEEFEIFFFLRRVEFCFEKFFLKFGIFEVCCGVIIR